MLLAEETLKARDTLIQMRSSDFPNIKDDERKKIHKELFLKAYPNQKQKTLTGHEIERFLNG